jgi:hypothetical protein
MSFLALGLLGALVKCAWLLSGAGRGRGHLDNTGYSIPFDGLQRNRAGLRDAGHPGFRWAEGERTTWPPGGSWAAGAEARRRQKWLKMAPSVRALTPGSQGKGGKMREDRPCLGVKAGVARNKINEAQWNPWEERPSNQL